jgi:tricorn protease
MRPYLIALRAGGAPPFDPAPRGLGKAADEKAPAADTAPSAVQIDLEGIGRRIAAFPVPEQRYGQVAGVAGHKVLWTVLPIAGAHGRGGHKDSPGRLEVFDFATGRAEVLMDEADAFGVAADHTTVLVRAGRKLRVIAADRAQDDKPAETTPSRKSGWIALERVRASVQPRAEWAQMLREVWRLQRDHFWTADLSGVDWDAAWAQYAPLLEQVNTRSELSDLIWELQGELGTSHAYEMGGDHRKPPAVGLGHLAAQWRWVDPVAPKGSHGAAGGLPGGYEIQQIVQGDTWDAAADSPLNAVGVEARVGERIVAVNGQPVSRERPPQALLVHQAGCKLSLTLVGATREGRPQQREVLVQALADETPAHYRAWVEDRRRWVHAESAGRVGYLHLPDMMSAGFAEFHRYFATECDREGLVVDLRYNRGGHVSSLLLEKVARRRIGVCQARWSPLTPYPEEAAAGPVVALTNEHAGSDGDIFSHGFKLMHIGPLVGTRTWGGVVGIWPRHALVDGTETTQPEYAFWFEDVGWAVENHGTEPDIVVDNAPQDNAAGRDVQLEVALAECLRRIDSRAAAAPLLGRSPRLARPPLPPRRP